MKELKVYAQNNSAYQIRTETLEGKQYMVVPVVMITEGVHNGSRGAVYHPADELGHIPQSFNGIPVTIQHPEDEEGNYISANSPNVLESVTVGKIYNTRFEENKVKAEVWLDVQRLTAVSPMTMAYIQDGQPLEVSAGLFSDEDTTPGIWNGEHYEIIARNHRPDHLALLPGGTGACSWEDGCGIRVNENKNQKKKGGINVDKLTIPQKIDSMKKLSLEGFFIQEIINNVNAGTGFKELVTNAQQKLDRMDDDMKIHFLQEIYDSYMVYEVRNRMSTGSELFKRNYSVNTDGTIDFTSDPTKVQRKVEYITQEMKRTKFNTNKNDSKMNGKEGCTECLTKIQALIASDQTPFEESDREYLMSLESAKLEKLIPTGFSVNKEGSLEKKKEEKTVNANAETTPKKEVEAYSAEDKAALEFGKAQMKARKLELTTAIQANAKDVWTPEELNAMTPEMLAKIAKSVEPVETADYSAAGGGVSHSPIVNSADDMLLPTGVTVEEAKK